MTFQKLKEAKSLEIFFYSIAGFILSILVKALASLVSAILLFLSLALFIWSIIKWSREKKQGGGIRDEEIKPEEPKVETDPNEMGGKSVK